MVLCQFHRELQQFELGRGGGNRNWENVKMACWHLAIQSLRNLRYVEFSQPNVLVFLIG